MADKGFTSLYDIKDFFINNIAPKYLKTEEINMSTVGIFGYTTEILANMAEDGANVTSMIAKEPFAAVAENPESLYLMATIYQLDGLMSTPSSLYFYLLVSQNDIIEKGTTSGEYTVLYLDSAMTITIEDIEFMLDHDIKITTKKTNNGYVHSAYYIMDSDNTLSDLTSPYIKTKTIMYESTAYLAMYVKVRQVAKTTYNENIRSNDKINVSSIELSYKDQLANFEIFYTENSNTNEVQMTKRMANTSKLKTPFCYYSLNDSNKLRIDFANDDNYFTPAFNSTLRIEVYTSKGKSGNFSKYTGTQISVKTSAEKYSSNDGLIITGSVNAASIGGKDALTTEELREAVITAQSTVNTYNITNDLQLFFKKVAKDYNCNIIFMKRRDDTLMRLFSAYILMKDENNIIMPTNTCDMVIERDQIDKAYSETNRLIVKAGKIFKISSNKSYIDIDTSLKLTDNLDDHEDEHLYTNPFLTVITTKPTGVGFYLNSINDSITLDYKSVNTDSFMQFIISNMSIKRNALVGSDDYIIRLGLSPSTVDASISFITKVEDDTLVTPTMKIFQSSDGTKYINNELLKPVIFFKDSGIETCYLELNMVDYDGTNYIFETKLTTDDYISTNSKIKILNSVYNILDNSLYSEKFIPCSKMDINLRCFFKYTTETNTPHDYEKYNIAKGFTLTNVYTTTENDNINLVLPVPEIKSKFIYNQFEKQDGTLDYNYKLLSVPVVKANYLKSVTYFKYFIDKINDIYEYLNNSIERLNNNFNIDIKFYNTFGPSKNYTVADGSGPLDKVNCTFKFGIKAVFGTDEDTLKKDIITYCKSYCENQTDNVGNNAVYLSKLITELTNTYASKIDHIVFKGINTYDTRIQTLESEITSDNIFEYFSSMLDYVPEYINIDHKIKDGVMTPQILIDLI